jgi:hypothetical protein
VLRYGLALTTVPFLTTGLGVTDSLFTLHCVVFNQFFIWACLRFGEVGQRYLSPVVVVLVLLVTGWARVVFASYVVVPWYGVRVFVFSVSSTPRNPP